MKVPWGDLIFSILSPFLLTFLIPSFIEGRVFFSPFLFVKVLFMVNITG